MTMNPFFAGALVAIVVVPALVDDAQAASRDRGQVTSCSAYSNGCLTVPVRQGRYGLEMRTRGGNWIDCRGDCRETLRQEVLDFWETQQEKALIAR